MLKMETRVYHGLEVTQVKADSNRICYIILPEGLKSEGEAFMENAAQKYGCNIAVLSGLDWNRDLSPWEANGVFKKEKPFEGKAREFLRSLERDFFLGIEQSLGVKKAERSLVGISLSGLFAVWAGYNSHCIKNIASISGSLWFDGFADWAEQHAITAEVEKVYLSLGEKEKKSKEARIAAVEECTQRVASAIRAQEKEVEFHILSEVTHFSPVLPRLEMALDNLYISSLA